MTPPASSSTAATTDPGATPDTPGGVIPAGDRPAPLSTMRATRLVAEREIVTEVRSKAFVISLIITLVAIIAAIVLSQVFGGGEDEGTPVAVVAGTEVPGPVGAGPMGGGLDLREAPDAAAAEQLLRDGDVEAIISADPANPTGLRVTGYDSPPTEIGQYLTVLPTLDTLEPAESGDAWGVRYLVSLMFGLVFMMLAMGSGAMIVQNTVLEKQSRIVEILLSAIPSRTLLAGKILGNSALAVGQAVLYAAAAAIAMLIIGRTELLSALSLPMLWFVLFFIPGFVLVAALFAASASLVSRQEDTGSVMMPTMMLVMAPYFLVLFFNDNPLAMTVMSYVPFSAPVAMPLRMFFGEAQWFEPLLSLAILVACTAAVIAVAGRIYRRSLLHTGQRMKLGAALRGRD